MTDSEKTTAPDEKKFNLLYDSLLKYHLGFIDASFKLAGLLLLVIGWLLTSDKAQASLHASKWLSSMAVVGLFIAGLISSLGSYRVHMFSRNMFEELKKLNYMPENYYSDRLIRRRTMGLFISAVWLLILSACFLITFNHLL